ncbi:MAG: LysR family transcriptional regulator [Anaerolineae bacterium]
MMELNYNHLRYFQAVAHEGNLTRAAERLHVSQSAVSVQIKQLETQLGHSLFERRGRQLVLTEAGHIALEYADTIFAAGDELVGTLHLSSTATRHVLRVGALATLSRNFQLEFLRPLLAREDVEIVLRSGALWDLLQNLEGHRLDVLLTNSVPARDAADLWAIHRIADQPVSLVGNPARVRSGQSLLETLAIHPVVLPASETGIRTAFDALMSRLGVRPVVAAEVDDMAMLRLLARENIGLAVVPLIVVRNELESGLLVEVERFPELVETFYAITPTRRFPNPLLKELIFEREPGRVA